MLLLLRNFFLAGFLLSLFSCNQSSQKENPRLIVKHVFTTGLPDSYSGSRSDVRHDYYYVYNYSNADYPLIEKMLDTLFIDTVYWSHKYLFLKYNNELPDSLTLKKIMLELTNYELEKDPGSAKYKKFAIVGFRFITGFLSEADQVRKEKYIPDNYRISTYGKGRAKERYFIKDSTSGDLVEVDKSVVSIPDSGIRVIK